MKTKLVMFGIAVAGLLSGCTSFQIKDSAGLQLAYEDVDRASSKGVELKFLKNVSEKDRQAAADIYREAKAKINSYLQGSITRASSYVVDEPADAYAKTKAGEQVAALQKKVNELRGVTSASVTPDVWVKTAVTIIEEIKKLNDQNQKAAYDLYVATVSKNLMKNYEELPGGGGAGK